MYTHTLKKFTENLGAHSLSNKSLESFGHSFIPVEQYRVQLARIKLLEDEVMTEKIKSQSIQKKSLSYIQMIQGLEYQILDLQQDLRKANLQLKLKLQQHVKIEEYEGEMRQILTQIASLNQTLINKGKECEKLHFLKCNISAENQHLRNELKEHRENKNLVKDKVSQILAMFEDDIDTISFGDTRINDSLLRDMDSLQQNVQRLKQQLHRSKLQLQKTRKQNSQSYINQKQEMIRMKYQLQLTIKRKKDEQSKKSIETALIIDKKVQQIIEQMLKKQDELKSRIDDLQIENQGLKQKLEVEIHTIELQSNLKIKDLERQKLKIKQQLRKCILEKNQLVDQINSICSQSRIDTTRSINIQVEISKKYREVQEERKKLQIKVSSLESDKQMLQKQLSLRGYSKTLNHADTSF